MTAIFKPVPDTSTATASLVSRSKLSAPTEAPNEIARPRLVDLFVDVADARLVIIRAAAGFGKTTTMRQARQACAARGVSTAWLRLDVADNDAQRFVATLSAALASFLPPLEAVEPSVIDLLDRLDDADEMFILFLDEFEALQSPVVLGIVRQLIEHLPGSSKIVIGSRTIPNIGAARLRVAGRVVDIDPAQLRFSLDETRHYLCDRKKLVLTQQELERAHERTEGWPAALSLLSLAIGAGAKAPEFLERFSGADAAIAQYIAENVLGQLPENFRRFLLQTSILGDFTPELCDAICGISNSRQILASLREADLFLIPLDNEGSVFRYHSLFADFLRDQLETDEPGQARILHLAAANWYKDHGRPVPAIEHGLASGDLAFALPLLDANAEKLLVDARMRLLSRWLGSLSPNVLREYPRLRLIFAWVLSFVRRPQDAMRLLNELEADDPPDSTFRDYVAGLRPLLLSLMDQPEEAYALGLRSMETMQTPSAFAAHMLAIAMASALTIQGKFSEAQTFINRARSLQMPATSMFSIAVTESIEGSIDLLSGRLRQATARLRSAFKPKTPIRSRNAKENAMAGILYAEALYEANELVQARRLLNVYAPSIKDGGLADQIITGHVLLARIAGIAGDIEQHYQLTMELEQLGYRFDLRRVVLSAKLERARFSIQLGNPGAAAAELEAARDDVFWSRVDQLTMPANDADTYEIGLLRLMIRDGRHREAVAPLLQALGRAEKRDRRRRGLKLRILAAEAFHRCGDANSALTHIGAAITRAAPEGFVRTFLDEGETVASVVRAWDAGRRGSVGIPRSFTNLLLPQSGLAPLPITLQDGDSEDGGEQRIGRPDELTPKEIAVLRLAAAGHRNNSIASQLFVSESTVRTHLRNINSKLSTHSRTQAIAAARAAGLLI